MENKRKSIHYGFVIIICCCLMMGVNIGLSFSEVTPKSWTGYYYPI